jgi:hypothetical protein
MQNPLSWRRDVDWNVFDPDIARTWKIPLSIAAIGAERIHPIGKAIVCSNAQVTTQPKDGCFLVWLFNEFI